MSQPGARDPPCTLQFPLAKDIKAESHPFAQGKAGCDPGGKLSPGSLPQECHGGDDPHRGDRQLRGALSYWGPAAHFSLSFPAPRGRVSAGRLPCSFMLVLQVGDQRCHRGGDSGVLCVVPAAQTQQAPHFSVCWRCLQIAAQGGLLPSSSPGVGHAASAGHRSSLLVHVPGTRSLSSPEDLGVEEF